MTTITIKVLHRIDEEFRRNRLFDNGVSVPSTGVTHFEFAVKKIPHWLKSLVLLEEDGNPRVFNCCEEKPSVGFSILRKEKPVIICAKGLNISLEEFRQHVTKPCISKDEQAEYFAKQHMQIEPEMLVIYRVKSREHEDDPAEPVKLLEVNNGTVPSGICPVFFDANTAEGIEHPMAIIEITQNELKQLFDGDLSLPNDWEIHDALISSNNVENKDEFVANHFRKFQHAFPANMAKPPKTISTRDAIRCGPFFILRSIGYIAVSITGGKMFDVIGDLRYLDFCEEAGLKLVNEYRKAHDWETSEELPWLYEEKNTGSRFFVQRM